MFIFYRICFTILYSIFNGKCEKGMFFLYHSVVGNNVAFVFDI